MTKAIAKLKAEYHRIEKVIEDKRTSTLTYSDELDAQLNSIFAELVDVAKCTREEAVAILNA